MLQDKRLIQLLCMMENHEYRTAAFIAEKLGLSRKTVRKLIKELDDNLEHQGARIVSKHGSGYQLDISEQNLFSSFKEKNLKQYENTSIPSNQQERIQYLLEYLLNNKEFVKITDLCDRLYVSKGTLTSDLKEIETLLSRYHLTLIRKPHYGIRTEGEEFNFRLCIANYIAGKNIQEYIRYPLKEEQSAIKDVSDCVTEALQANSFTMSDIAFQNLTVHIYVAIQRIREGQYVPLSENDMKDIIKQKEYQVASALVKMVNEKFGIEFPHSEIAYISIHLAGKRIQPADESQEENLVISEQINGLVLKMLEKIYEVYKIDFRKNLELRMTLCQHLIALEIRIKYDMSMYNPLLNDIIEQFSLAYVMALEACTVLNDYYHTRLKEDEIGYIALSIALALERQQTSIKKKNILLVCSTGKGSAQLMVYKYTQEFGTYLNNVTTCDVNAINQVDFSEIDYVFTTVPIVGVKIPVPILEVKYFLTYDDIRAVRQMLLKGGAGNSIKEYFHEELFLPSIHCRTKEEILKCMCDHIAKKRDVPDNFYELVMKRESLARTEFGNLVAMPHPNEAVGKETFVCVGVLEEPIIWEEKEVQFVFLVSIEDNETVNLQHFYEVTSKLLLDPACIQKLIKTRCFPVMMDMLIRIEQEGQSN